MLDFILDSLGVALLLGQAIYFWIFAEASIGAMPSGRSVIPATRGEDD